MAVSDIEHRPGDGAEPVPAAASAQQDRAL